MAIIPANITVTVNANGVAGTDRNGATFDHDGGSEENRVTYLIAKIRDNSAQRLVSTATMGGVSLSKIATASISYNYSGTNWLSIDTYVLPNSPGGLQSIVVTYNGTVNLSDEITVITIPGALVASPTGADETIQDSGATASLSRSITTTVANSLIIAAWAKTYQSHTTWTPGGDVDGELSDGVTGTTSAAGDLAYTDVYIEAATIGTYTAVSTSDTNGRMVGVAFEVKAAPDVVTVDLDTLTLATSAVSLDAVPGEATVALETLDVATTAVSLDVVPGEAAVDLDTLTLGIAPINVTATGNIIVELATLDLGLSAPTLGVVAGEVSTTLDTLDIGLSTPDLAVIPGEAAVALDTLSLSLDAPDVDIAAGDVAINLDTLDLGLAAASLDEWGPLAGPRYGLLAWWPLDITETVNDLHNGHNLTANGTASYVEAKVNEGAELESDNSEYLGISTTAFRHGTASFTIQGWVKFVSVAAGQRYIASNGSASSNRIEWAIRRNADRIEFLHSANGTAGGLTVLQSSVVMTADTWYFFSAKWDAATSTKSLTVNTTTVTAGSVPTVFSGSQEFYLGFVHNFTSNTMNGVIDNVTLYERALSAGEIGWHYNGGDGRDYAESAPTAVLLKTLQFPFDIFGTEIEPGETTVNLNTLTLGLGTIATEIAAGEVVVDLDTLTLTTAALQGEVVFSQIVNLNSLTLATSATALDVVPGDTAVDLNTLALGLAAVGLDVVPGDVVALLDTLSLGLSVVDMDVLEGEAFVGLNTLSLALSAVDAAVVPGEAVIDLDTLSLTLDPVSLAIAIKLFTPGRVVIGDRQVGGLVIRDTVGVD